MSAGADQWHCIVYDFTALGQSCALQFVLRYLRKKLLRTALKELKSGCYYLLSDDENFQSSEDMKRLRDVFTLASSNQGKFNSPSSIGL